MSADEYFARPLVCDLCERTAEGDAWPTHPKFGYRECPVCRAEGFKMMIPRLLSDEELAVWNESNTGW